MQYHTMVERGEDEEGVGGGCSLQRLASYMQYMVHVYVVVAIVLGGSSYRSPATESGVHV